MSAYKRTNIPQSSRTLVREREKERCARCAGRGAQWHHRRSRGVVRPHRHCACNGIWLCPTCHSWAHANPVQARNLGLILEREEELPYTLPVKTAWGWLYLLCDGRREWLDPEPENTHPAMHRRDP